LHPQVNVDFDAVEDKILRREYRPDADSDQSQSLNTPVEGTVSQLFEVWPEPPPQGHLHIFITLPEVDYYRPIIPISRE
jgi:hypothetical protein